MAGTKRSEMLDSKRNEIMISTKVPPCIWSIAILLNVNFKTSHVFKMLSARIKRLLIFGGLGAISGSFIYDRISRKIEDSTYFEMMQDLYDTKSFTGRNLCVQLVIDDSVLDNRKKRKTYRKFVEFLEASLVEMDRKCTSEVITSEFSEKLRNKPGLGDDLLLYLMNSESSLSEVIRAMYAKVPPKILVINTDMFLLNRSEQTRTCFELTNRCLGSG
ncbi:hypothetical protein ACOME3_002379 [Neoechinorhynchus agilis]